MENQKLEVKHITQYLPYDLQFKDPETVAPGTMVAIVAGMPGLLFYEDEDEIHYFDLHAVKPLLLPLSVLATNREIMLELINACYQQIFQTEMTDDFFLVPGFDEYGAKFQIDKWEHGFSVNFGGQKDFYFSSYNEGQHSSSFLILDKLELFRILYKHHIDVDGLIEAGLALNKLEYLK